MNLDRHNTKKGDKEKLSYRQKQEMFASICQMQKKPHKNKPCRIGQNYWLFRFLQFHDASKCEECTARRQSPCTRKAKYAQTLEIASRNLSDSRSGINMTPSTSTTHKSHTSVGAGGGNVNPGEQKNELYDRCMPG